MRAGVLNSSVTLHPSMMNDALMNELRTLLSVLGECVSSFRNDCSTLDCNSSHAIIVAVVFKLEKAVECAKSILKICKSLKKESIPCLPCLNGPVDNQPQRERDPSP